MKKVKRFEVEIRDGKPFYKEHLEGCSVSYADYEVLLKERNRLVEEFKICLQVLTATGKALVQLVNVFGKGRHDGETSVVRDNCKYAAEKLEELQKL